MTLVDIDVDPAEHVDLAEIHPEIVDRLTAALNAWRTSVRDSFDGQDFQRP